jgi:hypothetical protein
MPECGDRVNAALVNDGLLEVAGQQLLSMILKSATESLAR